MTKFTLHLKMCLSLIFSMVLFAFTSKIDLNEQAVFLQKMLTDHYDESDRSPEIKRYELHVTNTGFCRYKRHFKSGKVEYFSFNLIKFKELDYYGTDKQGVLYLRTKGDDVIVQTYRDKKGGDVDSMASYLSIPLKNIEPDDLIELTDRVTKTHAQLLAQR